LQIFPFLSRLPNNFLLSHRQVSLHSFYVTFSINFPTVRFRQKAWDEEAFAHEEEDDNDPDAVGSDPDGGVHMHRGNGSQPASSFQHSCDTVSPETRFSLPLRYVHLVSFKYFALEKFLNVLFKRTAQKFSQTQ
jgi:hypothetical protein